jgi:diphthamide biosynthesis protein 4
MPTRTMTVCSREQIRSHYETLGLPRALCATSDLSAHHLKAAYRRALLQHHPDKIRVSTFSQNTGNVTERAIRKPAYTIDQISEAYATLSDPKSRAEHDRDLALGGRTEESGKQGQTEVSHTGLEIVDLDDLAYDETEVTWYRSCRCGDERGFLIREADLEEASDLGELHVGCKGCSLWLKVLFGVVEEGIMDPVPECG